MLKREWFLFGCCGKTPVAWSTATVGLHTARGADRQAEMALGRLAEDFAAVYREQAEESRWWLEALQRQATLPNPIFTGKKCPLHPTPGIALTRSFDEQFWGS